MHDAVSAATEQPWNARFRGLRVLDVVRVVDLTPRMRRITLGGCEVAGLGDGPNIKLAVPPVGVTSPAWPLQGPDGKPVWPEGPRPVVRTYTIRHRRSDPDEIDIDFVLHGHGVASSWAQSAKVGSSVMGVGAEGGLKAREADWYFLIGDETALPAIERMLEELPAAARGHAFITVPDQDERRAIDNRTQIEVRWLLRNSNEDRHLLDMVRALVPPPGQKPFLWVGAESRFARALKKVAREEFGLDRRQFLIIGYWKEGMSETDYHDHHDNDRDEDYYAAAREDFIKKYGREPEIHHHDHSH